MFQSEEILQLEVRDDWKIIVDVTAKQKQMVESLGIDPAFLEQELNSQNTAQFFNHGWEEPGHKERVQNMQRRVAGKLKSKMGELMYDSLRHADFKCTRYGVLVETIMPQKVHKFRSLRTAKVWNKKRIIKIYIPTIEFR